MRKKTLIFSEILFLVLVIGSSIAVADTGFSEEYKSLDILENVTHQTDDLPKLESAPINPEFTEYHQKKILTQMVATQDEHKTGLIPSPVDLSHLSSVSAAEASYPASYDLRTWNKVTNVKKQEINTCWIFATYGSLESYLMPGENWDFSENNMKNLLSSAYPQGFDGVDSRTPEGNNFMSTAYLARWSGPVSESDDPYYPSNWTSPENLSSKKHVQNVFFIPDRQEPLENDDIKWAIQNYGGVFSGMYFENTSDYYKDSTYSYYYDGIEDPNHAVTIVGWDDNYDMNEFKHVPLGNGAFIIKNSYAGCLKTILSSTIG